MTTGEPTRGERPAALPDAWDDERLAAAFLERYDRPAPHELAFSTLERVRATSRRPRWLPSVSRPTVLRLASAVAVVAILAVLVAPRAGIAPGSTSVPTSGPSTVASPAQNTPYQSFPPSPAVAGFPAEVAGLLVHSITDIPRLLADPALGDTELAIAGWYSASDLALPCPFESSPAPPIEIRCSDVHAWLSATDRPILSASGSFVQPANPAALVALRFVPPADPLGGDGGQRHAMNTTPRPVVVIGHFHDERSSRCPADELSTCEQTFVVDVVSSSGGTLFNAPTSVADPAPKTRLSAGDALRLAQNQVGADAVVLQIGLEFGSDPPWFLTKFVADCLCPPTWFVRGYRYLAAGTTDPRPPGTPVAGWLVIDDATGAISGPLTEGIPPQPTPYPYASPPVGFPSTIEGLPVRTVADLADLARPRSGDDAPFAVAGWLFHQPVASCLSLPCDQRLDVLAGTDSLASAAGAVIYPVVLPGSASLPEPANDLAPRRVILVGHQDDPRARRAQGSIGAPEATDFVLDQVAWLDGVEQPATAWIEPGIKPIRTLSDVLVTAGPMPAGQTWLVSAAAVRAGDLAMIGAEPSSNDMTGIVWVLRMVGANPVGGSGGLPGWGTILVEETTGQFETRWTSP